MGGWQYLDAALAYWHVVFSIVGQRQQERKQQYAAASVCTDLMGTDSSTCRLDAPMTVTDKWVDSIKISRRSNRHIVWHLGLRTDAGSPYIAEFYTDPVDKTFFTYRYGDPPAVYSGASTGAVVRTERWQDKVIWVSVDGRQRHTHEYYAHLQSMPGEMQGAWMMAAFCFSFVCLPFIVIFCATKNSASSG